MYMKYVYDMDYISLLQIKVNIEVTTKGFLLEKYFFCFASANCLKTKFSIENIFLYKRKL